MGEGRIPKKIKKRIPPPFERRINLLYETPLLCMYLVLLWLLEHLQEYQCRFRVVVVWRHTELEKSFLLQR